MERYLEGDIPSFEELEETLAHGVADGDRCSRSCAARRPSEIGVDRLAEFICEIGPSPLDRPGAVVEAGDDLQTDRVPIPTASRWRVVFKTIADPYVGRVSLFKVLSGTIKPDAVLTNTRTGDRRAAARALHAAGQGARDGHRGARPATSARSPSSPTPRTGDTLAPQGARRCAVPAADAGRARARRSRSARSRKGDDDKLMTSLHRLQDEDPTLVVERNDETHQTLLGGAGETHLAVVAERLDAQVRRRGRRPRRCWSPYRETITAVGDGRGQAQEAERRPRPVRRVHDHASRRSTAARASSSSTRSSAAPSPASSSPRSRRASPRRWRTGGHYGYPGRRRARSRCIDGKYHAVDSSEMSFKMAGSLAFREAMAKAGAGRARAGLAAARSRCPTAQQGDVMGDLNARRGRVQGTERRADGEVDDHRAWCRPPRCSATPSTCGRSPAAAARFRRATTTTTRSPAPRRQGRQERTTDALASRPSASAGS